MSEDKSRPGHMLPFASHMDPIPGMLPISTPGLDAMNRQARTDAVPDMPVKDMVPMADLVQTLTEAVTAEVLRKIKIGGQLPITVSGNGLGGFAIGWNAPVELEMPLQLPVFQENTESIGTASNVYALKWDTTTNSAFEDYWDLTAVSGGKDDANVNLFPTYDSVSWKGVRVVYGEPISAGSAEKSPYPAGSIGEFFESSFNFYSRQITVNSKGAVIKIGAEFDFGYTPFAYIQT